MATIALGTFFIAIIVLDGNNIAHGDTVVPSTTIVYANGTGYVEKNSANKIVHVSDNPETVISDAIKRAGNIYIGSGKYDLSDNFTGFTISSKTQVSLDSNAILRVASGYRGYVFKINGSSVFSVIQGGQIAERNPVQKHWTGIIIQAGNPPTSWNTINNIQIEDPHVGILFSGSHNNFATTNLISNTMIDRPIRGIDFNYTGYVCCTRDGFNYNTFYKVDIQASPDTLVGFNNIGNVRNEFYNSKVWDTVHGASETRIGATSTNTMILGGKMTEQGKFIDHGTNTLVYDSTTGIMTRHYSGNATWDINNKLTFTPDSNMAGINIGCTTRPPSTLTDGDIWCDYSSRSVKTRIGGSTLTVIMGSNTNTFSKTNTFDGTINAKDAIKVNSNKFLIRNSHGTYATSIRNSAQMENNTITIPLFKGSQTFALVPEFNSTTGQQNGNGTGTVHFSPVMDGVYATLTPKISGNATISVSGDAQNSIPGDGCRIDIRYSTSSMGGNGAAAIGKPVGTNIKAISATKNQIMPWSRVVDITGLSAGTKYYFDLSQAAITGGVCMLTNVYWTIHEY